jgi:hypothetical protein
MQVTRRERRRIQRTEIKILRAVVRFNLRVMIISNSFRAKLQENKIELWMNKGGNCRHK